MTHTKKKILLESEEITKTIGTLRDRINKRLPKSGLIERCDQLYAISSDAGNKVQKITQPISHLMYLRWALFILIAITLITSIYLVFFGEFTVFTIIFSPDYADAEISLVLLLAGPFVYLWDLEKRKKQKLSLDALHEIRVIAHIIDMHQLTKDPNREYWVNKGELEQRETLNPFEMGRYLDYCSEMLALAGKVSAIYIQELKDPVVISAVNEIEVLTTGLSRKIWQKLMVMHEIKLGMSNPQAHQSNG